MWARLVNAFVVVAILSASFLPTRVVAEDSPLFDCATMGNQVCGPGIGPNHTDHNVFYGNGPLPVIPS